LTHADPGAPDAAFVRLDDPIADADAIARALAAGFAVRLPGGAVARCDPVTRSDLCVDADLAE